MYCPYCSAETKVLESRLLDSSLRRRRECLSCQNRFTTYEQPHFDLKVIKKDGREQSFNLSKISTSIQKACNKITPLQLEQLTAQVQQKIIGKKVTAISSKEIGKLVLQTLKKFDPIAYLRFATVYKKINDIDVLGREIQAIQKT